MLAIRTTAFGLETPIVDSNGNALGHSFLASLIDEANRKLLQNFVRSDRFFLAMKDFFRWPSLQLLTDIGHDSRITLQRWGHSIVQLSEGVFSVGGFGTTENEGTVSKRGCPALIAHGLEDSNIVWKMQRVEGDSSINNSMHGAAGTIRLDGTDGPIEFILLSGGRQSPLFALPCARSILSMKPLDGESALVSVRFSEQGDTPSPRWGHSLSNIDNSSFLLFGGRDSLRVFDDAFILSCELASAAGSEAELVLRWSQVDSPFSLCGEQGNGRFFHAACYFRDVFVADRLSNLVVVHGGLASLATPDPGCSAAAFVFSPSLMKFLPLSCSQERVRRGDTASRVEEASRAVSSVHRFAHTLTYLGKKTILLLGGTDSRSEDDASSERNFPCFIHLMLDERGHHTARYSKPYGAERRPPLPCQPCRCHHQAFFQPRTNRVHISGGGVSTAMFGPHYCTSLDVAVCFANESSTVSFSKQKSSTGTTTDIGRREKSNSQILAITSLNHFERRTPVIVVPQGRTKAAKVLLEQYKWLNKGLKIVSYKPSDSDLSQWFQIEEREDQIMIRRMDSKPSSLGHQEVPLMGLPVTSSFIDFIQQQNNADIAKIKDLKDALQADFFVMDTQENDLSRQTLTDRTSLAREFLLQHLSSQGSRDAQSDRDIPDKFEVVGDVLMIPSDRLTSQPWQAILSDESKAASVWSGLAAIFGLKRVARKAAVDSGPMRKSRVSILFPSEGCSSWVTVVENSISFSFDITKVMFCSGNVTERMRMARQASAGEVVLDLYCGVGYYTLPLLVHGRARLVHACEWNPDSIAALRRNLKAANVEDRCVVHEGDNRQTTESLVDIADRVLLGLLPSSVDGWSLAARAIRASGGIIHVHENVSDRILPAWKEETVAKFNQLLNYKGLEAVCRHVEKVKSYAPHVYHVVLDLVCTKQPVLDSSSKEDV